MEDSADRFDRIVNQSIADFLEKMDEDELSHLQEILYKHCTSAAGVEDTNISELLECVERVQTAF